MAYYTCIYNLHDDPKEIGMDECYMLAHNVPVSRDIHNGTFPTQIRNRRVFELGAVEDLDGHSLA